MNKLYPLFLIILLLTACQVKPKTVAKKSAEIIYYNGDILTMNDIEMQVESIAIKDGKILDIGFYKDVEKLKSANTTLINLNGKTLLPGFIDAHSHFSLVMKMITQANLSSPPIDSIKTIPDIIDRLSQQKSKLRLGDDDIILGWGYDPDQLIERRHPTNEELTKAFPSNPVFILHASFHMGVVNQAALDLAGITAETANPAGGMIVRDFDTKKATGLLQETAMYLLLSKLPSATAEQMDQLFQMTQQSYARHGITTAQDGLTDYLSYQYLVEAAKQGKYFIDVEALASFRDFGKYFENPDQFKKVNRFRLAGMKITTDGSPQGKTAFFKKPYLTKVPGCMDDCRGFPMVEKSQLIEIMTSCYSRDIQLYVHCNGDASIDMLLTAHKEVTTNLGLPEDTQRTVVIHSQFVRPDQLQLYKAFNFVPSFFTNHAFFWGDVHTLNLGHERADFLSPMQSAYKMGITATNHTDYLVTPLDQLFLLWTSVNRTTRDGRILGKTERLTPYQGLQALTINSAYQHKQEQIKGSIAIGKLADFVILDRNPVTVHPDEIRDIKILETIKEGKTIYSLDI